MRRGETVIDVACGTGLNFEPLREAVGSQGRIIGVDISGGMLALARERSEARGWSNVELLEGDVAAVELPPADAALFSFTHDVLRSRPAVEHVVGALRGGGRVAGAGVKYAHPAAVPVNVGVRLVAPRFVTTREGLREPWSHLEDFAGPLQVKSLLLGSLYVAHGSRC